MKVAGIFLRCFFLSLFQLRAQVPQGFLLGESVKVREQASRSASILFRAGNLSPVEILSVSQDKEGGDSQDTCDYYPWVEVKFQDGKTGFVFGKSVYKLSPRPLFSAGETPDQQNCGSFLLYEAKNFSLGPLMKDARGKDLATGCDDYTLPVFWMAKERQLRLLYLDQPADENHPEIKFWRLTHHSGRVDAIHYIQREDGLSLHIAVYSDYTEGCGGYEILLRPCGDPLSGRLLNRYRKNADSDCKK